MKTDRLAILEEIDRMQEAHCTSCEHTRTGERRLVAECRDCAIGAQLRGLGDQLLAAGRERKKITGTERGTTKMAVAEKKASKASKEEYLAYRAQGLSRKDIAKKWSYTLIHLESYWLKKWGLRDPDQEELALIDYLRPVAAPREMPVADVPDEADPKESADEVQDEPVPDPEPEIRGLKVLEQKLLVKDLEDARKYIAKLESQNAEAVALAGATVAKMQAEIEQLKADKAELHRYLETAKQELEDLTDQRDMLLQTVERAVMTPAAGEVDALEAIEAALSGLAGGRAYVTGAAIESLWRWQSVADLQRARQYIDRLIGEVPHEV